MEVAICFKNHENCSKYNCKNSDNNDLENITREMAIILK